MQTQSMFQQGITHVPYMSYDTNTINPYNYKNLFERYPMYQVYQDLYYNTRQINPITISNLNEVTRDPSNLPCDYRTTIYSQGDANNNELLNLHRTIYNNPNLWRDNHPAKGGYFRASEQHPQNIRPISFIDKGQATSHIDVHGFYKIDF